MPQLLKVKQFFFKIADIIIFLLQTFIYLCQFLTHLYRSLFKYFLIFSILIDNFF